MEFEQCQPILQTVTHGRRYAGIQNELNREFGLDDLKKTAVHKRMSLSRLGQTSADDTERPGRPRTNGIDFSILRCLEYNPYSSTHKMAGKLGVAHWAALYYLVGSFHMAYVHTKWDHHNVSSENIIHRVTASWAVVGVLKDCRKRQ
jgi:hypothetical protein